MSKWRLQGEQDNAQYLHAYKTDTSCVSSNPKNSEPQGNNLIKKHFQLSNLRHRYLYRRSLEEHSSHTAHLLLFFDENLEILINDRHG